MGQGPRRALRAKFNRTGSHYAEHEELCGLIEASADREAHLLNYMRDACTKDSDEKAVEIEIPINDWTAFITDGGEYVRKQIERTAGKDITYRKLQPGDQALFDEAMARELAEFLQSVAVRKVMDEIERKECDLNPERVLKMRWLLTWKPVEPAEPPAEGEPSNVTKASDWKAKARIVIIGYQHPYLIDRDPGTGRPVLETTSPTLSRHGRHMVLQTTAMKDFEMECGGAKSAFLQADKTEEDRNIWARGPQNWHARWGSSPRAQSASWAPPTA